MSPLTPGAPELPASLDSWLSYLEALHPSTIDLGLERIGQVAARLDLDFSDRRVITVGGTNGKGTTAALLSSLLRGKGYKVGTYTSPHLLRYNERVRIDGEEAADEALCAAFAEVERARLGVSLTYFEFGTLAALLLFRRQPLDFLVLEVGLGGRLDAVNLVDADVAIVTNVALDHLDWLGDTREAIGREKAGIYRAGKPAVYGETSAPASVAESCAALGAPLFQQGRDFGWQWEADMRHWRWRGVDRQGQTLTYEGLPPTRFVLDNVSSVLEALHLIGEAPERELLIDCLEQASLEGRFQLVDRGGHRLLLDVAHNPHAALNLAATLKNSWPGARFRFVIAMLRDKDSAQVVDALLGLERVSWYVGTIGGERGAPAEILYNHLRGRGEEQVRSFGSTQEAFRAAEADAQRDEILVVTGSFFTVTAVLELLREEAGGA